MLVNFNLFNASLFFKKKNLKQLYFIFVSLLGATMKCEISGIISDNIIWEH